MGQSTFYEVHLAISSPNKRSIQIAGNTRETPANLSWVAIHGNLVAELPILVTLKKVLKDDKLSFSLQNFKSLGDVFFQGGADAISFTGVQ
jgi:hypothetical protein